MPTGWHSCADTTSCQPLKRLSKNVADGNSLGKASSLYLMKQKSPPSLSVYLSQITPFFGFYFGKYIKIEPNPSQEVVCQSVSLQFVHRIHVPPPSFDPNLFRQSFTIQDCTYAFSFDTSLPWHQNNFPLINIRSGPISSGKLQPLCRNFSEMLPFLTA